MEKHPLPVNVEPPPPLAIVVVLRVFPLREVEVPVVAGRLVGMHALAAEPLHEQTARGERRVANALRRQPPAALPGEKPVVGVAGEQVLRGFRRHPVGPARHDRADEVTDAPAVIHELERQIIEQLRMVGQLALAAEVAEAAAEAGAEEDCPDPVGGDAGGELGDSASLHRGDEPAGEVGPCGAGSRRRLERAEEGRDRRLDQRTRIVHPVAARQDADRSGLLERLRDHQLAVERTPLLRQRVEPLPVGDERIGLGLRRLGPRREHERRQAALERVDLGFELLGAAAFKRTNDRNLGGANRWQAVEVLLAKAAPVEMPFVVDVGKEGPEAIEVGGRVGVVLVIVALGAAHRGAHPGARHAADPVGLVDRAVFLRLQTSFVRRLQEPVVGTRQHRILGMLALARADEVAGQLQFREPVEGDVVEECLDHPVAIRGDVVRLVAVVAHRVGVADEVEPPGSEPLGMARRDQEPLDQPFVAVRLGVGEIGIDLRGGRRQTREIESEPSQECERVGVGRRGKAFRLQPREHEPVDPDRRPRRILHRWRTMPLRCHVGPMRGVWGTCGNPLREEFLLRRGEHVVALGRWHHHVGVGLVEAGHEFALLGMARHDRPAAAVEFRDCRVAVVESQAAAAVVLVGPVAGEAVVRQDRPDVPVEVGRSVGGQQGGAGDRPRHRPAGRGPGPSHDNHQIRHETPRIHPV